MTERFIFIISWAMKKVYDLSYYNLNDLTKIMNKDCKDSEVKTIRISNF